MQDVCLSTAKVSQAAGCFRDVLVKEIEAFGYFWHLRDLLVSRHLHRLPVNAMVICNRHV